MPNHAASSPAGHPGERACPSVSSPLRDWRCHARLWLVAVAGLLLDLWTKRWAFERLDPDHALTIIPGLLSFRRSVNPGALFGMGQGLAPVFIGASVLAFLFVLYLFAHSRRDRWVLHVALGLVLAGALGNLYDRSFHAADAVWAPARSGPWWQGLLGDRVCLAVGKLVGEDERAWLIGSYPDGDGPVRGCLKGDERYLRQTPIVRDFIKLEPKLGKLEVWPWIFNVADMLLVFGVAGLVLNFWQERRAGREAVSQQTGASRDRAPS